MELNYRIAELIAMQERNEVERLEVRWGVEGGGDPLGDVGAVLVPAGNRPSAGDVRGSGAVAGGDDRSDTRLAHCVVRDLRAGAVHAAHVRDVGLRRHGAGVRVRAILG